MKRKVIRGALIGLGVAIILNIAFSLGIFKTWQDKIADSFFLPKRANSDIVIIAIDDKSISSIGRFPWDRGVYAKLLDKFTADDSRPASIGIDISFLEKSNDTSDNLLASAIKKNGNVILAAESSSNGQILLPIEVFDKESQVGIANTQADTDGVTRFAALRTTGADSQNYESFAYQVSRTYLNNSGRSDAFLDGLPGRYQNMRINYVGGPNSFKIYSFNDVLAGPVDTRVFKGKIVLIGATAADLHDAQTTPTSGSNPMAGVEIQANAIQTILDGRFLVEETRMMTLFEFFFVTILVSCALILLPVIPMTIFLVVSVIAYIVYAIISFDHGVIRNVIYPVFGLLLVGLANIVYKYFSEFRQKRYIRKAFSYYLSESVLSDVLSNPDKLRLGGVRQEMTVLFSDIAGFTTISERINPELLPRLLNDYLTRMTRIIFKYNGVLDKYIGDAVMAFWGAPIKIHNHALLACQAALEMHQEVNIVAASWRKLGFDLTIRIGINTGDMIVGNMGSVQRFDYTLLGDNVNLGSRLEGVNKEYGTSIIISEATYKQVADKVIVRKLDTVAVKGKEKGIVIYELIGMRSASVDMEFLRKFEEARQMYATGDFPSSLELFKKLSRKYPIDRPTKVYISRLQNLPKKKVSNWDGVYRAKEK